MSLPAGQAHHKYTNAHTIFWQSNLNFYGKNAVSLLTETLGLIDSDVVDDFCCLDWPLHSIDNNVFADFSDRNATPTGISEANGAFRAVPNKIHV